MAGPESFIIFSVALPDTAFPKKMFGDKFEMWVQSEASLLSAPRGT